MMKRRAMYGFGVALATRGNSPLGGLAIPLTPLNPLPPEISGLNTKMVFCSRRDAKNNVVVSDTSRSGLF
jgi:hypothetical protein